jgi:superfamily II DNA or RNA helicase
LRKSGLIAITPFTAQARRVLVIAPGASYSHPVGPRPETGSATKFYERFSVLGDSHDFPQTAVVESGRINVDNFRRSDIAVANIHQVAGNENRWLDQLDADFFDLILVDEAHHDTGASWQQVKTRFPRAKIVNYSATPTRADGRVTEGEII